MEEPKVARMKTTDSKEDGTKTVHTNHASAKTMHVNHTR